MKNYAGNKTKLGTPAPTVISGRQITPTYSFRPAKHGANEAAFKWVPRVEKQTKITCAVLVNGQLVNIKADKIEVRDNKIYICQSGKRGIPVKPWDVISIHPYEIKKTTAEKVK